MKYFSTLLPPPNLTGALHLGHMWNGILQDVLYKFYETQGIPVYWGFGVDHAGISLQIKVESELKKQGIKKLDLTKQEFSKKLWEWKDIHSQKIKEQYKFLNFGFDVERERFTLDEKSVSKVIQIFKQLYKENLIYREKKLVNWDPKLNTAISDIEVIYKQEKIKLYTLFYKFEGKEEFLKVATTRPETIFGDAALFVNPKDERYLEYVGKKVQIPFTDRYIPILVDEYVDSSFGTGVMKCTPAHDFQDYDLGKKHNLEFIEVFGPDLVILVGPYKGLSRDECKKQLISDLQSKNLVIQEDYETNVIYSERSGALVEPILSLQWFLKSSILAKSVLEYWQKNKTEMKIYKSTKEKILENMFLEMKDWCISRQLEWGIKIPVWIGENGEHSLEPKEGFIQSEDVLDTWFSSSLWPLIVFEDNKDLLPLSVLISGRDILLFWISRMIFMHFYVYKNLPFKSVYLHGLVLDSQKRKMSKSLNNGIDPIEAIKEFGNDILRLFFVSHTNYDSDISFSRSKLDHYSKFLHKFKNAYKFLQCQQLNLKDLYFDQKNLNEFEAWIFSKLCVIWKKTKKMYSEYKFAFISKEIMNFVWDDFCNKYLEVFKVLEKGKKNTKGFMAFLWHEILYLLRPLAPEITAEIYKSIFQQDWNKNHLFSVESFDSANVSWFFDYMSIFSEMQKQLNLDRNQLFEIRLITNESSDFFVPFKSYFELLNQKVVEIGNELSKEKRALISLSSIELTVEIFLDSKNVDKYRSIQEEKKDWLRKEINFLKGRLSKDFIDRAPEELIEEIKEKILRYERELKFYA